MPSRRTFETTNVGSGPFMNALRIVTTVRYLPCIDAHSILVLQGCLTLNVIVRLNKVGCWHLSCDRTRDHRIGYGTVSL